MAKSDIILGLYPQPPEPQPFHVVDAHGRLVEIIHPDEFWEHASDAMSMKPEDKPIDMKAWAIGLVAIDDIANVRSQVENNRRNDD